MNRIWHWITDKGYYAIKTKQTKKQTIGFCRCRVGWNRRYTVLIEVFITYGTMSEKAARRLLIAVYIHSACILYTHNCIGMCACMQIYRSIKRRRHFVKTYPRIILPAMTV